MRVLCVDHEEWSLNEAVAICRENPAVDAVVGLGSAAEVREWFKMNRADFALIDGSSRSISSSRIGTIQKQSPPRSPVVRRKADWWALICSEACGADLRCAIYLPFSTIPMYGGSAYRCLPGESSRRKTSRCEQNQRADE